MRRHLRAVAVLAVPLLVVQTAAWALWIDGSSASGQYSSASLAAPTSPATAAGVCVVLTSEQVVVSWTATASTWADGYEIARSTTSGGPYSVVGTVLGQPATAFTDGPLAFLTTYYYVVRATKNGWRSADTAQVARRTLSSLCL